MKKMEYVERMSSDKWKFAQEYELPYQTGKAADVEFTKTICAEAASFTAYFEESLEKFVHLDKDDRVLEIGSGPTGLIFFMRSGKRFAVDPLLEHYERAFAELIDYTGTDCIAGIGEALPFKEESFDMIIIHNVLDHTDSPKTVLREARRILKKDGHVYIGINTYAASVYIMSRLFAAWWSMFPGFILTRVYPDVFRAHPHLMSKKELGKSIDAAGFRVVYHNSRTRAEARKLFRQKRKGLFWHLVSFIAYSGGFETVLAGK